MKSFQLDIDDGDYTPLPVDTYARCINNVGQIVGERIDASGSQQAVFLASVDSTPVELSPLPGDTETQCLHINDDGIAIGVSMGPDPTHASSVAWRVMVSADGVTATDPIELPRLFRPQATSECVTSEDSNPRYA